MDENYVSFETSERVEIIPIYYLMHKKHYYDSYDDYHSDDEEYYVARTVLELMEKLPDDVKERICNLDIPAIVTEGGYEYFDDVKIGTAEIIIVDGMICEKTSIEGKKFFSRDYISDDWFSNSSELCKSSTKEFLDKLREANKELVQGYRDKLIQRRKDVEEMDREERYEQFLRLQKEFAESTENNS